LHRLFFELVFNLQVNPVAPIYVGQLQNGVVWVRVEGKGSFQNSHGMKKFAALMITKGANQFVIDLENCPVMDSTFMGTLVGIKKSLGTDNQGNLEIINANSRNTQLLVSLGIDLLLKLDTEGSAWAEIRNQISNDIQNEQHLDMTEMSKEENIQQSLEAHQNLSNANKNNVPRFRDVIHFLEQELGQQSAS